jgi:hypothetical protein
LKCGQCTLVGPDNRKGGDGKSKSGDSHNAGILAR